MLIRSQDGRLLTSVNFDRNDTIEIIEDEDTGKFNIIHDYDSPLGVFSKEEDAQEQLDQIVMHLESGSRDVFDIGHDPEETEPDYSAGKVKYDPTPLEVKSCG